MLMDGDPKIIGKLSSECMNSWYFSREELERFSPSRKDGISEIKESELRKLYCSFLRDVGIRLKLPQVTIATSMIFCHRFYLHQSHTKNGWQTIATVCIFLASKVEDTPCPLDQVIRAAYETMFKRDPAAAQRIHQKAVREKQKALILIGERLVLKTIRFDFNIQHPYRPLLDAMKNLGINQKEVRQVALNFVNDWLRTTLCLQYKPHYVAAGSLYLAAKLHNVKLPLEGTNVWWHKFDVAPKPLEAVIQQMMELVGLKLAVADPGPVKQSKSPSEAKLQIFNSPNSVLSQSSLSRSGLSPDIDGEPNGRLQVDSDQDFISSHTGQGANSCPDEKSLDVNTTGNGPSGTANGENKDQELARKHGDGVISCPDVRSLDTNAAFESSNKCMELATTNYDHSNETLNGQNSSQALISGHRGDGVNPLSEGRLLDANAISKSTSKSVEPVMTNCNHCGDALNAASSCAYLRPANAATSSIENAPCVQPAQMNVDHFNEELKKIDVARIKDLLAKRKRQREIQQQAITSDDLSEQAWIERELELGIGAKREAEHLVSSDDLSDDIWIERELESGIVVGPGNNQVVTLDGLSEDDWIERELGSGIIVEPEHVGKKRRLESSCC